MRSVLNVAGPLLLGLGVAMGVTALVKAHRWRRRRKASQDPLSRVFGARELRKFDAHLDKVAVDELGRLILELRRYVAGEVGHVVVISNQPGEGIVLGLSDGRLMTLTGVARVTRGLLPSRAANDKLRPARVDHDGYTCRLLLRGESGFEMSIHTRRVYLTSS